MRTYTNQNITLTFQESVVWLWDSNTITIESANTSDKVGGEIIIRHPNGTETRTIRHISELSKITFVIDDALMALADDNIGQYTTQVNVYNNGALVFTKSFAFQLLYGKSFTNQSHAMSRTAYIYDADELIKFQVYSPSSGVFSFEGNQTTLSRGLNQYNLSSLVTSYGTYDFCLQNSQVTPVAIISGDNYITPTSSKIYWTQTRSGHSNSSTEKGGNVWRYDETIFPVCCRLIFEEPCRDNDFVELMYRDTDGCFRYLGGKLANSTDTVSGTSYTRLDYTNVFRNIPHKHTDSTKRTLKVGFIDIARNAYPQDILYSDEVFMRMYNGEWWPVTIGSDKIEIKSNDTQDIELEIIISEE